MPTARPNLTSPQTFTSKISKVYSELLQAVAEVDSTIGLAAQPGLSQSLLLLLRTIQPLYEASISSGPALREMQRAIKAMEGPGGIRASYESFNIISESLAETLEELEEAVTSEPEDTVSMDEERWLSLTLPVFSSYVFAGATWALVMLCISNKGTDKICFLSSVAFFLWAARSLYDNGLRLPTLSLEDTSIIKTRVHLRLPDHLTVDIFVITGFAIATFYYPCIPTVAYALLVPGACTQLYRMYQATSAEHMQEYTAAQVVQLQQHIRLYVDRTKDIAARAQKAAVAVELGEVSPADELSTLKAFRQYLAYSALDYQVLSRLMQREQFRSLLQYR